MKPLHLAVVSLETVAFFTSVNEETPILIDVIKILVESKLI